MDIREEFVNVVGPGVAYVVERIGRVGGGGGGGWSGKRKEFLIQSYTFECCLPCICTV